MGVKRQYSDAEKAAAMAAMLAEGESLRATARAIGASQPGVARWAYRHGQATPRPARPAGHVARMVELYELGVRVAYILAQYNVSPTVLYRVVAVAGVPLRRPGVSAARRRVGRRRAPTGEYHADI